MGRACCSLSCCWKARGKVSLGAGRREPGKQWSSLRSSALEPAPLGPAHTSAEALLGTASHSSQTTQRAQAVFSCLQRVAGSVLAPLARLWCQLCCTAVQQAGPGGCCHHPPGCRATEVKLLPSVTALFCHCCLQTQLVEAGELGAAGKQALAQELVPEPCLSCPS